MEHDDHADEDHADEDHADEDHEDEHGHGEPTVFSNDSDEIGATFDLSSDDFAQKVSINMLSEEASIAGSEAFMNPATSDEVTLGYYASTDIGQFTVDFGARFDFIDREGSLSHEEEHHDEDHADEDHADEHHDDEHEMEYYSRSDNNTSLSLSISNELTDSLSFTLGLSNVERSPSVIELFMNGAHMATGRYEVGNVNLMSETSNNIDLNFVYDNDGYFGTLSFFRNEVDNYIYLMDETEEEHEEHEEEHDHGGLTLAEYLQNDAKFTGYEFELGNSYQLENGTLTATVGLDSIIGKFKESQMFVPRMMPKRRFISLDYVSGDYSAGISYKKVELQDKVAEGETGTDGYGMLDLDASKSYELGDGVSFRSTIFIKNLLDETARNHTSFVKNEVPLAGRNVGFKFRITF